MTNYDVFISYSRKDSDVANRIYDALAAEGITCFIDREGISGGADFPTVLSEAIMGAKLMIFVASENSYASEFTQKELTFAVSNKGSRFIFPVIIDGSTLPKNLEFLLSNINWRTLSFRYTIEKEMVADVKKKLSDPHAGETLAQREKSSVKGLMIFMFVVIGIALATVLGSLLKNKQEERKAESASQSCQLWLNQAGDLLHRADSLRASPDNFKKTFDRELACLDEAEVLLRQVDSVRQYYTTESSRTQTYLKFTALSTDPLRRKIQHQRDSMFISWKENAQFFYDDYLQFPLEDNREMALEYVTNAIRLRPSDPKLQDMKKTLSQ
jgi:hypothetical protein